MRAIANELDQEYGSEPDGETLGTINSTRNSEGEEDDLSFISHSDNFLEIVDIVEWRARNDAQEVRLLRKQNCALRNAAQNLEKFNRNLTRIACEVIDLTDHLVEDPPSKRTRFE